jgi:hypothetical protein
MNLVETFDDTNLVSIAIPNIYMPRTNKESILDPILGLNQNEVLKDIHNTKAQDQVSMSKSPILNEHWPLPNTSFKIGKCCFEELGIFKISTKGSYLHLFTNDVQKNVGCNLLEKIYNI